MKDKKLYGIIKIPLYFLGGILFSLPYTGGSFSPFAASFAASCSGIYSIVAAAGSIFGILIFQTGLTCFRYFAIALTSAATLNIALRAFHMGREKLIRIICPVACCFSVNFIFLISQKLSADLFLSVICETILCGATVPVFTEALKQIKDGTVIEIAKDNPKNFVCFAVFISLLSAQLRSAGVIGKSICCFAFFFMILFFSQMKNFQSGIITGICCSFSFAMNGEADFAAVIFSLCGCVCTLVDSEKRIVKALFAVLCAVAACALGEYTEILPIVPSAALAGFIFSIIPQKFIDFENEDTSESICTDSLQEYKSNKVASAVSSISDCVAAARKTLEPLISPALEKELVRARDKVCGECEICESCINEIKQNDNPCFKKIAAEFDSGEPDFSCFPENFNATCYHSKKMLEEMKRAYFIHCTSVSTGNKINRMQTLAGNQFRTFGGIIGKACEISAEASVISSRSDAVCAASVKDFGVDIKDARLCTDKAGREYYDVSFLKPDDNFSVTALTEKLKEDTGFELDFPTLVQNGNIYDLIFKQKEKLTFNISAAVKPAADKSVCGDYYRCFKDSFLRQTVLLSDGMGTGKRAAVDSAFTCETFCNLIKSGLDEKTAAAAVNCAMMIKSTDESFSTIDFLRLDPVLKKAEVFKCGAAPTFILKKKKVLVIETESTPIGILDNVNMSVSTFDIDAGDVIIIASDGVSSDRFGWIGNELKSCSKESSARLARHILQCAADRKIGKRSDDMTVIAVCVADK